MTFSAYTDFGRGPQGLLGTFQSFDAWFTGPSPRPKNLQPREA